MSDVIEPTGNCKECYYFKQIGVAKTCGLFHQILRETVVGCYAFAQGQFDRQEPPDPFIDESEIGESENDRQS
jgi:hypothetical protein